MSNSLPQSCFEIKAGIQENERNFKMLPSGLSNQTNNMEG